MARRSERGCTTLTIVRLLMVRMIVVVVVIACTITLTATMEAPASSVQLVEAAGVDEAGDLLVLAPRGLL